MLAYLTAKDTPLLVADTHAGAGAYSLVSAFAQKKGEFKNGIGRLWGKGDLPPAMLEYLQQVRTFNPDGALRGYPGSPQIALQMTRPQDRLSLFELHTTEIDILRDHFRAAGRRVSVQDRDGFSGLKSVLPPPSRRGLALIDPSYEDKSDYASVLTTVRDSLQRFATGTYAVWYPQVQRRESLEFPAQLQQLAGKDWLHASLKVMAPARDGLGLHGSGMFVFNPPWKLETALRPVMPVLAKLLGQDGKAAFGLHARLA